MLYLNQVMCMLASKRYKEITGRCYVYNIMPITNIPSVMCNGILSFNLAEKIDHQSVAMNTAQQRRAAVRMPDGRSLHDYANLYFSYWNPMLSVRRGFNDKICILALYSSVLDIAGCVVSDQNAAADLTRFYPAKIGIEKINFAKVHAESWKHSDIYEESQHKKIKCAEILVPDFIEPTYIAGAYVHSERARQEMTKAGFSQRIVVTLRAFF